MADGDGDKRADLVFEGGGVKGIGLAGAFCHLAGKGYVAERVAGTSAGAITAAMVAAGMPADDLRRLVLEEIEFARFEDGGGLPWSQPLELLRRKGLHPGTYFEGWMREQLTARGVRHFGDLRLPGAPDGDPTAATYRLQVIASDVSCHRLLVLPRDARHLGVEPDDLEVAAAVRMSMSIPVFFDPVVAEGPGKAEHVVVDGGLLSNFPVWLFDAPPGQEPRWPTFGFLLVAPGQRDPLGGPPAEHGDLSLPDYAMAIVHTVLEAHDRLYLEQADFARTITIDTLGVETTQFSIDHDGPLKQQLFASGEAAAAAFLAAWDFDGYKRAFRAPAAEPASRRERVARVMAEAQ